MRVHAVLRFGPDWVEGPARELFWQWFWRTAGRDGLDPNESEDILRSHFGRKLVTLLDEGGFLPIKGYPRNSLKIRVSEIRYGSIEVLLLLIGGEELFTEAFWSVLEFQAPQAFNDTFGTRVPLTGEIVRQTEPESSTKLGRTLRAAKTPVVALVLILIGVIYLQLQRIKFLEKELIEFRHDYGKLVSDITQQNTSITTSLLSKLGIGSPGTPTPAGHHASAPTSSPSPANAPSPPVVPAAPTQTQTPSPAPAPSPSSTH